MFGAFVATLGALTTVIGALPASEALAAVNAPTAKVKNGTYAGRYLAEYNQDVFLGIPFAQPPVGDLRFSNPVGLNTSFEGTRMVPNYAPECVGYGSDQWGYPVSEDCLYLNIIRPTGTKARSGLPVAVWIHGGGYYEGGAPDQRYNLSFIVQNSVELGTPMIGIGIAYRLSAWGFLASAEVAGSGNNNFGLRDQRLALHWIQENVAAFGGDPSKVTIWGQSAGASAVGTQLVAYGGRDDGLFRGAIMESGGPIRSSGLFTGEHYQPLYEILLGGAGCDQATDSLACLRKVPFTALNNVINSSSLRSGFGPIIDGDFITQYGSVQLEQGDFVRVPMIYGANTDEGTSFGPYGINTPAEFKQGLMNGTIVPKQNLSATVVQTILDAYPDDPCQGIPVTLGCLRPGAPYGAEFRRTSAYAGDTNQVGLRRFACQAWAKAGVQSYCYRYNGWDNGLTAYTGVGHFQEVALVFDNVNGVGYDAAPDPFGGKGQAFRNLAKLMSNSWVSFVTSGNPNTFRQTNTNIPLWPIYNSAKPQIIVWTSHLEADTFRESSIATIKSLNLAFHR